MGAMESAGSWSSDLFVNVFTNAPIGMFVVQDRVFRFINPQFQKNTGYSEHELIGRDSLSLVTPEDRARVREKVVGMLKGELSTPFELRITNKSGEIRWAVESVASVPYEGRRAVLGYFLDITDMKSIEEALREREEMYRAVVENSADAIVITAGNQRVFANKAYLDIHGVRGLSAVLGKPADQFVVEEEKERLPARLQAWMDGTEVPGGREYRIRRPDGQVRILQPSASVITYKGERALLAVIRDVTESKRLQDELARSNAELEQFAYIASHDLQEPLRMVAGYTHLLEKRYKGKLDTDAEEFIHFAVDGATRMERLINDLLAYSRVATQKKEFTEVDCETVVKEAEANLATAVKEAQATVAYQSLPKVMGNNTQLCQLFQNLIGNAVKFRGKIPPKIQIEAVRKASDWLFSVRDNGLGINPQYADKIFQLFQRLHTQSEYPGTGIGLAICKKVVERHGGRIWVEPNQDQGSTFYFTIPAIPEKWPQ